MSAVVQLERVAPGTLNSAPRGVRLHIAFFGRRNVGKSSLLNALTRQQVSIVSPVAGTTTDPVEKPMELLPLGPVVFIDTAGIDDEGDLGAMRVGRTKQVFERADLAVLVAEASQWNGYEEAILAEMKIRKTPTVICLNKCDVAPPDEALLERLRGERIVRTSAVSREGLLDLREALLAGAPPEFLAQPAILGDLVGAGGIAILVIPIDKEAPRGRIILPQVQAIRDLLDHDACCMVVKERDLPRVFDQLKAPPKLVVTDSQAFAEVAAATPEDVPLTSFSIVFARYKGDLAEMARGAVAIDSLKPGDRVLVSEACCHHPIEEDIGRVKIPRWLARKVGGELRFDHVQGHDFPADLKAYKLVIQCGACMINRREVLGRIERCTWQGVPITNYGLAIAASLGIFERALALFPAALAAWRDEKERRC